MMIATILPPTLIQFVSMVLVALIVVLIVLMVVRNAKIKNFLKSKQFCFIAVFIVLMAIWPLLVHWFEHIYSEIENRYPAVFNIKTEKKTTKAEDEKSISSSPNHIASSQMTVLVDKSDFLRIIEEQILSSGKIDRKDEQQFSSVFGLYSAFLTLIAVAFTLYTIENQKKRDHESKNKAIQHASFEKFYELLTEFDDKVANIRLYDFPIENGIKTCKERKLFMGPAAINYLYQDYREKELKYIKENNAKELKILNDDFMRVAKEINISAPASVLFKMLNWIRSQEIYYKSIVKDSPNLKDDPREIKKLFEEITRVREAQIKTMDCTLTPVTKYVFGKYRHLEWNLDATLENIIPSTYRGLCYADTLLHYEETLYKLYQHVCIPYPKELEEHESDVILKTEVDEITRKVFCETLNKIIEKRDQDYRDLEFVTLPEGKKDTKMSFKELYPNCESNGRKKLENRLTYGYGLPKKKDIE